MPGELRDTAALLFAAGRRLGIAGEQLPARVSRR